MCASPINWKINLKKICREKETLYLCIVFSNEKLMDNGIQVSAPNGCLFFLSAHNDERNHYTTLYPTLTIHLSKPGVEVNGFSVQL